MRIKIKILLDFIEDKIKNSSLNVKNANKELNKLNENTENYRGLYYWLCIFSFFTLIVIVFIFYYKYFRNAEKIYN